jgi:methylmalonyl-CoA mutase
MWEMFTASSSQQWKAAIEKELKGKDYESTLVHDAGGDIRIAPIYHSDQSIPAVDLSGTFHRTDNSWEARQDFLVDGQTTVAQLRPLVLSSLNHGIPHLAFHLRAAHPNLWPSMLAALADVNAAQMASVTFYAPAPQWLEGLLPALKESAIQASQIRLVIDSMPLVLANSRWSAKWHEHCQAVVQQWSEAGYVAHGIDGRLWYELGVHAGLELALIYAQLINQLGHPDATTLLEQLSISVCVGRNFFADIAKLRALRAGFKQLQQQHGWQSTRLSIFAQTAVLNKSQTEPANNLMRNTTEAIAAIVGGCDVLSILAHDGLSAAPNAFSIRMAQNIHNLLREESHLDKVIDPGQGAYFIEYLSDALLKQSLEMLGRIQAKGGLTAGLSAGWLQQDYISPSQQETFRPFAAGAESIIGVNKYPFDAVSESMGILEGYGLHSLTHLSIEGDEVPFEALTFQRLAQAAI